MYPTECRVTGCAERAYVKIVLFAVVVVKDDMDFRDIPRVLRPSATACYWMLRTDLEAVAVPLNSEHNVPLSW